VPNSARTRSKPAEMVVNALMINHARCITPARTAPAAARSKPSNTVATDSGQSSTACRAPLPAYWRARGLTVPAKSRLPQTTASKLTSRAWAPAPLDEWSDPIDAPCSVQYEHCSRRCFQRASRPRARSRARGAAGSASIDGTPVASWMTAEAICRYAFPSA